MCGIVGLIDPALSASEIRGILQRMADAIRHRGPDDEGFFALDGVGLGMRRLSIIDLAGGHQPIGNENGAIQVVFNGEIYNYADLRRQQEARGHLLRTHSDTEVIAHAYEDRGVECLTELRGMFGIALWDQGTHSLLLARDRLGKKPLFYARRGERFLFGSEMKAILAADPHLAELDPEATLPYFRYGFVPEPQTMFRRIHKLPAAHYLLFHNGAMRIAPYWELHPNGTDSSRTPQQWVEELDALLEESVRIRLMSEVPLGVFLSGGLDSSSIVAYAHKAGLRPLKTFTIGFDRPQWDESADAHLVAQHLDTEHHVLTLQEHDLADSLPETLQTLVRHFDEPFGDSSALPTYHVSRLARQHVTVILSGDGGDELFAGYSSYRGAKFAEYYRRLPSWLGGQLLPALAQGLVGFLSAGRRDTALRGAKVLRDSALPFSAMYFSKMAMGKETTLQQLFTPDLLSALTQREREGYRQDLTAILEADFPIVNKMGCADLRFRLVDDMLVKVDRMSMAHSLEVRSPFLDHRLVEFAASIPPELKLRGWQTKAILRDTVQRYLPPSTLRKRKQGFEVPLRAWLQTSLSEMVGDYLETNQNKLADGMINGAAVHTFLRQHQKGEADHSAIIWLLLNYAVWRECYLHRGA